MPADERKDMEIRQVEDPFPPNKHMEKVNFLEETEFLRRTVFKITGREKKI